MYKLKWKCDADGNWHRSQQSVIDTATVPEAIATRIKREAGDNGDVGHRCPTGAGRQITTRIGGRVRQAKQSPPPPLPVLGDWQRKARPVTLPPRNQRDRVRFRRQWPVYADRMAWKATEHCDQEFTDPCAPARTKLWTKHTPLRLHLRAQMISGVHHPECAGRCVCAGLPVRGHQTPGVFQNRTCGLQREGRETDLVRWAPCHAARLPSLRHDVTHEGRSPCCVLLLRRLHTPSPAGNVSSIPTAFHSGQAAVDARSSSDQRSRRCSRSLQMLS